MGRLCVNPKANKFYNICKKLGGANTTHNISDCEKYHEDGNPKKSFKLSKEKRHTDSNKKKNFYSAWMRKNERLQFKLKMVSKLKRKRKREYVDSSNSDSDSSWRCGWSSTGGSTKEIKLTNKLDVYSSPAPNKVTQEINSSTFNFNYSNYTKEHYSQDIASTVSDSGDNSESDTEITPGTTLSGQEVSSEAVTQARRNK